MSDLDYLNEFLVAATSKLTMYAIHNQQSFPVIAEEKQIGTINNIINLILSIQFTIME